MDWLFNLHDNNQGVARKLADGITARVFLGKHTMLSVVTVEPNSMGKIHSHPEEQWGVLIRGECIRIQDDMEIKVKVGDFWHTPGNVNHGIRTESKGAIILDIFSPPKQQYEKSGDGY